MGNVNDMTDAFDTRLSAATKGRAPQDELDAWITVYERTRTARAICQALFPSGFDAATVAALASEIRLVKQSGQAITSRP